MKKIFTLMLGIALFCSIATVSARTYLVQLGTPGDATWRTLGVSDSLFTSVNLSSAGTAGAAVSLNAWYADKKLATPSFAGTKFVSGDKVYLTKGTYTLDGSISLMGGVSIYGGFLGSEMTTATRAKASADAWDFTNVTAIDGANTYIGFTDGSGTTTIVDGITIQNCKNSATSGAGGAAKLYGSGTVIQNSIITACSSLTSTTGASGAVVLTSASSLKNCYIHHNTGLTSGAITVMSSVAATSTAAAIGSKVTGCKIEYNTATTGSAGAMYLYGTVGGANISYCTFYKNTSTLGGGAIYSWLSNSTNTLPISINNCIFSSNSTSGNGGAINLGFSGTKQDSTFNVSSCTFVGNVSSATSASTNGGGAISMSAGRLLLDKCTFIGNSTTLSSAGAILLSAATTSAMITNSKFVGNTAGSTTTATGSAIYSKTSFVANNCVFTNNLGIDALHFYTATVASTFQNCTFADNITTTGTVSGLSLLNLTPKYAFTNCLFYKAYDLTGSSTPNITYSAFDITPPVASTNITGLVAGSFVNPVDTNVVNRSYGLAAGSIAIDKGTNLSTATYAVTTDILGAGRPAGSAFDMGAYEFGGVVASVNNEANNELKSISVIKNAVVSNVQGSLQVIDFNGRVLSTTLVEVGTSVAIPSGIYIIKVQSKEGVSVQKVVL